MIRMVMMSTDQEGIHDNEVKIRRTYLESVRQETCRVPRLSRTRRSVVRHDDLSPVQLFRLIFTEEDALARLNPTTNKRELIQHFKLQRSSWGQNGHSKGRSNFVLLVLYPLNGNDQFIPLSLFLPKIHKTLCIARKEKLSCFQHPNVTIYISYDYGSCSF